jgi:hypothetical protein
MTIPFDMIAVVVLIPLMPSLITRNLKDFGLKVRSQAIQLLILCISTMYPFLISSAVSPFKCDYTNQVMFDAPSLICFQDEWNRHLGVSVFFLFLYALALPLLTFHLLVRSKKNSSFEAAVFKRLTEPYKDEFYWWEAVQILKRTGFAVSNAFFRNMQWQDLSLFFSVHWFCLYIILISACIPFRKHRHLIQSLT